MTEQYDPEQQPNTPPPGFPPPPSGVPAPAAQQDAFAAQQSTQQPVQQAAPQAPQQYPEPGGQPVPYPVQPVQQPFVEDGSKRHVHHTYIWLGSIKLVFTLLIIMGAMALPVILEVLTEPGSSAAGFGVMAIVGGASLLIILLIIAIIVLFTYFSYRNLTYEIGEKEFSLYSGILNKKRVHIPYQRVQSVNQKATLFQRIFGVCTVHIDTAGGSMNKAVVVPYLQNFEAERIRGELFARKQAILEGQDSVPAGASRYSTVAQQGTNVLDAPAEIMSDVRGVFGGMPVNQGSVSYEYGLSNKELVFTGLSGNTGFVLMLVAVIGSVFGFIVQILETRIGQELYDQGLRLVTQAFASSFTWMIVGVVLVGIAFVWVISILTTCVFYGGFKARRQGTRIEVEHGLLQHRFHGVDIDRVQSVIIKQSFIRRLLGYCELSLGKIDAQQGNSSQEQENALNQQGLVVHPFVKMSKVPEILAGLVPEFADVPTDVITLPKVARRRAVIRRGFLYGAGFWIAIAVLIYQVSFNVFASGSVESLEALRMINMIAIGLYILCFLIMVTDIVRAILWFKGSSFAYNKSFMQVTNGGFSRESISFPRKKIQYAYTRTNPFQRAAHVTTVSVRTAAGVGGTTMRLIDASEEDAKKWLNWTRPGQGMVE